MIELCDFILIIPGVPSGVVKEMCPAYWRGIPRECRSF